MRGKPKKGILYTCRRFDCLYHPPKSALNGCDYCLVVGRSRNCKPGVGCDKYVFATQEEQRALSLKKLELMYNLAEPGDYC